MGEIYDPDCKHFKDQLVLMTLENALGLRKWSLPRVLEANGKGQRVSEALHNQKHNEEQRQERT